MIHRFLKNLGANPDQYSLLLKMDRLVNTRRDASKSFFNNAPTLLVALYVISSTLVSLSAFALDSFSFSLLTLFLSMTMLTFTVISRLEVVINPSGLSDIGAYTRFIANLLPREIPPVSCFMWVSSQGY